MPKTAKLKPADPKKGAEEKAKKLAKKHSRDKNSTSQIRVLCLMQYAEYIETNSSKLSHRYSNC